MPAHPPISTQGANANIISAQPDEQNYIYIALYMDGVYRQRCATHLHWPKAKLVMIATKSPAGLRRSCPECHWAHHIAPFLPPESPEDALHEAT